jgi:hypothetical protein
MAARFACQCDRKRKTSFEENAIPKSTKDATTFGVKLFQGTVVSPLN